MAEMIKIPSLFVPGVYHEVEKPQARQKKVVVPEHGDRIAENLVVAWFSEFRSRFAAAVRGLSEQKISTHIDSRLSDHVAWLEVDLKRAVKRCVKRAKGKGQKEAGDDMRKSIRDEVEEFEKYCKENGFLVNRGEDGEGVVSQNLQKSMKHLIIEAGDLIEGWAK